MLEQCWFVSQRQRDSSAVGQEHSGTKWTMCILKMNEWEWENYILRTKRLECSQ